MNQKLFLIFAFACILLYACGSNEVELPPKETSIFFSKNFPGKVSFNFFQSSTVSSKLVPYETKMVIKSLSNEPVNVSYEVIIFKDANITNDNIDHKYIGANMSSINDTIIIGSNVKTLLRDENLVIGLLKYNDNDVESIIGSYNGELKIFNIVNDTINKVPSEIISITGFIDMNQKLFFLTSNRSTSSVRFEGAYSKNNEFIGGLTDSSNFTKKYVSFSDSTFVARSDYKQIKDTLKSTIDNRILTLLLTKTNQP